MVSVSGDRVCVERHTGIRVSGDRGVVSVSGDRVCVERHTGIRVSGDRGVVWCQCQVIEFVWSGIQEYELVVTVV